VSFEKILQSVGLFDPLKSSHGVGLFVVQLVEKWISIKTGMRCHQEEDDELCLRNSESLDLVLIEITNEQVTIFDTMRGWTVDGLQFVSHRGYLSLFTGKCLPSLERLEPDGSTKVVEAGDAALRVAIKIDDC
jgi:hypothetical protein